MRWCGALPPPTSSHNAWVREVEKYVVLLCCDLSTLSTIEKACRFQWRTMQSAWRACSGVACPTCCSLLARRSFQGMAQGMASESRTGSSAEQSTAAAEQAQRSSTSRPVFGQSRGARECDRTPEPFYYDGKGSRRGLRPPRGTFTAHSLAPTCALSSATRQQGTCEARRADWLERRRFEHRHGMGKWHARRHGF